VVTLGLPPQPISFRAFAKDGIGNEVEVTTQAEWSADPRLASVASDGTATLTGVGGKGNVTATYKGVDGTAQITVKLIGAVFGGGADATTNKGFERAAAAPH